MSTMEDRLRQALRADAEPVVLEDFLADVRRGARRRTVQRRSAVTAGFATLAVAVVALVASWAAPDRRSDPQPVDVVPRSSPQVVVPAPLPDGRLYGLAGDGCDRCPSVLWVEDDRGRAREVHTFAGEQSVAALDLAPDGRHGFAFGGRDGEATRVWRTQDGGHTWVPVEEQLAGYAYPPDVEFVGDEAYLLTRSVTGMGVGDSDPHLWRTRLDGAAWEELPLPSTRGYELDPLAGLLSNVGTDGESSRLGLVVDGSVRTSDNGTGWTDTVDLPCRRQADTTGPMYAGDTPSTLLVWCPAGDRQVQFFRSVGFGPFEVLGPALRRGREYPTADPTLTGPFPVETEDDGAYALVRVDGTYLRLEPGGRSTEIEEPPLLRMATDAGLGSSHLPGRTWTAAPGGVISTDDGGLTWTTLED